MECVDDVAMDTNKYLNFQRQNFRQQHNKQQYLLKRVSLSAILGGILVFYHVKLFSENLSLHFKSAY